MQQLTMQHRIRRWADSLWPDRTVADKLTNVNTQPKHPAIMEPEERKVS